MLPGSFRVAAVTRAAFESWQAAQTQRGILPFATDGVVVEIAERERKTVELIVQER